MNEFSIEHDGRFSLSLTCSERYHGHHEQVSNKEPRSLPQNVPPGDTSLAAQSKERELYSQATIALHAQSRQFPRHIWLHLFHTEIIRIVYSKWTASDSN